MVDLELKAMVLRLRNIPITTLPTTLFNTQTDLRSIKDGLRLSQRHLTYHKMCPQRDQVGLGFLDQGFHMFSQEQNYQIVTMVTEMFAKDLRDFNYANKVLVPEAQVLNTSHR